MKNSAVIQKKAKKIKCLIVDVDGVLTEGKIIINHEGKELKNFNVQDGLGLILFKKAGFKTVIITAKFSEAVKWRSDDLKIDRLYQNASPKIIAYEEVLKEFDLTDEEVCFIGDDLPDLAILKRVGLSVTVPNGREEIKKIAMLITKNSGGEGAVREVIDLLLKAQGKWKGILDSYA